MCIYIYIICTYIYIYVHMRTSPQPRLQRSEETSVAVARQTSGAAGGCMALYAKHMYWYLGSTYIRHAS